MSSPAPKSARKRADLNPPSVVIQSTGPGRKSMGMSMTMSGGSGGMITRRSTNVLRSSMAPATHVKGEVGLQTKAAVSKFTDGKMKEKQEMKGLNAKLAQIMEEKVYNEANQQMLIETIEKLKREKCPDIGNIHAEYKDELEALRNALDEQKTKIIELEAKNTRLNEELGDKDDE